MLKSRREETDDRESPVRFTGEQGLSIEERRAQRKAKRQETPQEEPDVEDDYEDDDDEERGSATTDGKGTRTPTRREAIEARRREAQGRAESVPLIGGIVSYFRGVNSEVRKVTWPTREEARRLTSIVLAVTITFSLLLGGIDLFYGEWFRIGIENTTNFLIIGGVVGVVGGGLSYFLHQREII